MAFKNKADQAKYHKEVWYPKNKERRAELNKAWRERNKLKFQEWKAEQQCSLCLEKEPCCLEFHHLDPSKKEYTIASVSRFTTFDNLLKEINKCVVLCANCHRKVHAGIAQLVEQVPCKD